LQRNKFVVDGDIAVAFGGVTTVTTKPAASPRKS
jgi:hypothetical protein